MSTKRELERRRLHALAEEYKSRGYRVVALPLRSDLPEFLTDYEPDIIAYGPTEAVVIQIKSRPELIGDSQIEALAEAVEKQKGWRFELDIVAPPEDIERPKGIALDAEEIRETLAQVQQLHDLKLTSSAYILAWTLAEAAMRYAAARLDIAVPDSPQGMISVLYSEGIISFETYNSLRQAMHLRNVIVHGFKPLENPLERIADLTKTITDLLGYQPQRGA
jgi:uncharacterized protein YutE (UPF0331/DUF86 family)